MKFELPKDLVDQIKNAPRGIVPAGIKAAKEVVEGKEYVSTKGKNLGTTYTKHGPISIIKKGATPATKRQALAARKKATKK